MGRSIIITCAAVLALSGCSSSDQPKAAEGGVKMPSSSTTIPQKVDNAFKTKDLPTATRAAQEYFDRAASEDYEGAYDLTSTKFRNSMTKRGYVRMQKACVKVSGLSGDVTGTWLWQPELAPV